MILMCLLSQNISSRRQYGMYLLRSLISEFSFSVVCCFLKCFYALRFILYVCSVMCAASVV